MSLSSKPNERTAEAGLRILEKRISVKMLAYYRDLYRRIARDDDELGIIESGD